MIMADFCKQCAEELFGKGTPSDFRNITKRKDSNKGFYFVVLCEGCGPIQVDPEGRCISNDCLKKHGIKTGAKS